MKFGYKQIQMILMIVHVIYEWLACNIIWKQWKFDLILSWEAFAYGFMNDGNVLNYEIWWKSGFNLFEKAYVYE